MLKSLATTCHKHSIDDGHRSFPALKNGRYQVVLFRRHQNASTQTALATLS